MKKLIYAICIALSLIGYNSYASHIPGGNITYQCTGNPNEFIITMNLFVSCPSSLSTTSYTITANNTCGLTNPTITLPLMPAPPGGSNPQDVSQICPAQQNQSDCVTGTTGGLPGVEMYTYQAVVTLPGPCDSWTFSYEICCRDASTNTNGGTGNSFYTETVMNSQTAPCEGSPYVTAQPIPYVCAGQNISYCPGGIDPDGDSLYYQLVNPMGAGAVAITHPAPYGPAIPLQNLTLDPATGCIDFNQPTTGNFVVTYLIEAYDNNGNMTGSIVHDFQFEVITCTNTTPDPPAGGILLTSGNANQTGPNTIELCEGENACFSMTFSDPDATDVLTIDTTNSNIFAVFPGATITVTGTNPVTIDVCWTVPAGSPSQITATTTITDGACPIEGTATQVAVFDVVTSTVADMDTTICGNQGAQLIANGGTVFNWTAVSGDPIVVGVNFSCNPCSNPVATPSVTTTYEVVSNLSGGCDNIDSVTVTVVPDFTPTAYGDTLLCDFLSHGIGVNVNPAAAGYTYNWTPNGTLANSNSATPTASPTETTTYNVLVTSPLGCAKVDSVTIDVNPPPSVTLVPGDSAICDGDTLQFDVSLTALQDEFTGNFDPAVWGTVSGATVGAPCVPFNGDALNFDAATRELITVPANVASCTSIDFCLWIANDISTGPTGCENADPTENVELSYSTNGGATWTSIQIFMTDDWDAAGPYANTWQCFSIPIPAGAATASTMFKWAQIGPYGGTIDNWALDDISIMCGGNTNYTYSWAPATGLSNPNINNPVATPNTTTVYTVTLTDSGGCSVDRTQTITVAPAFTATLNQSSANTCLNDPIQLDATVNPAGAGYSYLWTPAAFLDSDTIPNPIATITTPGTYTYVCTITNAGGCTRRDSIMITIQPGIAPTFTLTAADSLIFCGQSTQLVLTPDSIQVAGQIDDFNTGINANWGGVTNGTPNTNCGSVSGDALHFDGTTTPREAFTVAQNVTTCTTIDFCLFIGNSSSGGAPCENADTGEDVELQYSTNGGATWVTIQVFNQADWDAAGPYNNTWQCFSIPIPAGAISPTTQFKWVQPNFSACTGCDNWALDDVNINCSAAATNYNYSWTPNNAVNDDTLQSPFTSINQTTTYYVTVTNPNGGCTTSDSVTVHVTCGDCFPAVPTWTDPTCNGGNDGQIIATPNFSPNSNIQVLTFIDSLTGTTLQVSDTLYPGDSDTLNGIPAGTYIISAWDSINGGCVKDTVITLTEPDSVLISNITANDIICIGGSKQIDATATGGNGNPYTYFWTDVVSGNAIPGNGPHTVFPTADPHCYEVYAEDALGCISDTQQVCIVLHPALTASSTDTAITICHSSSLANTSTNIDMSAVGGSGSGYNYNWYENGVLIGSGGTINVTPTSSPTTYIGVATDNCTTPADSVAIVVDWFTPTDVNFTKNRADSCYPITVELQNVSNPMGAIANSSWSISDGTVLNGDTVAHLFGSPVCHDVTLTVTDTSGCVFTKDSVNFVCPHPYPEANFYMTPPITNVLNTEIDFTNLSTGNGLSYLWNFGSGLVPDSSSVQNPTFVYPDDTSGTYNVLLTVTNQYGCVNTINGTVFINSVYLFYIPNSFTPDGDGKNEFFRPEGEGIDLSLYTMQIFNRWGELLYEAPANAQGWNGTYNGSPVQVDTYVWRIVAKELDTPIIHENYGHVNLIR